MDLGAASKPAAGVLFLVAVDASLNAYSSINSSPWTSENFGGDPDKAAACRKYVYIADTASLGLGALGAWIAGSWWPLVGAIVVVGLMHYLYVAALAKAQENSSTGWS